MKNLIKLYGCVFCIAFPLINFGQKLELNHVNDGPYIFYEEDSFRLKQVVDGVVIDTLLEPQDTLLPSLHTHEPYRWKFKNVEKYVALSDVHGQFDLMASLLKAHQVIDSCHNWKYGAGHLVVVGDIFDRGNQVTQILWLLYELEQQALKDGGRIHVLLGNHEIMVLAGDTRYVHRDYRIINALLKKRYEELFSNNSVLGKWLRSKPIAIKINKHAFVHAGFSPTLVDAEISIDDINRIYKNHIIDKEEDNILADPLHGYLYAENGPIWYRGYSDIDNYTIDQCKTALKKLNVKSIIVGHTSKSKIEHRFDKRIIFIDSSIKYGESGELLIFEDGKLLRGLLNGGRQKL